MVNGERKLDKKTLWVYGIVVVVIQTLLSCNIFVTFSQMAAYAAPKDALEQITIQLNRIEHKLDKVMGY